MKKLLLGSLATIALSFSPLTPPAQAQWTRVCTRDYNGALNLRNGPGRNYYPVAQVPNNAPLRILSYVWGNDNYRWLRIETSGLVGFVREDYVCY